MAESTKKRRDLSAVDTSPTIPMMGGSGFEDPASDLEVYAKEVLMALISDNLPPTPYNFSLYFDRLLENKSDSFHKQVNAVLELEEDNDNEKSIALETSLKQGFSSVKSVLQVSASLYQNISLMMKVLQKRKDELQDNSDSQMAVSVITSLEHDVDRLSLVLKKQVEQMKTHYDDTASIVKNVEKDTIFDNEFGVYNRRYLLDKVTQESSLIKEFSHKSSLIMLSLSKSLKSNINHGKALRLMTRTIARMLLKTSRRSDIVAHYGDGVFAMLLKHTNLQSAKKASERLSELVASSNFFLAEREVQLRVAIGVKNITTDESVESMIACTIDAMEEADSNPLKDYSVCQDTSKETNI